MSLKDKIQQLPVSPGVYLMRDASEEIIYVGKARNLRQRVRSYFTASGDSRYHVKFLVAKVADIEVMLTDTEKEALLLENTLIKQHHPRYNLDLKDDKTYFSLRLDPAESFPRFTLVRKIPRDHARYFGPYSSASSAREVLRQITRMFPLRHYPLKTCMSRKRPCLYHQIGQCSAPCHGFISVDEYAAITDGAMLFLDGKGQQLVAEFKRRMSVAAEALNYEEAARWRNLLRSIEVTVEKQKVVTRGGDSDVIGFHRDGSRFELALLFIRSGVLTASRIFSLEWELDDAEALSSFIRQFYTNDASYVPEEIFLPLKIEDNVSLSDFLSDKKGKKVIISKPQRGVKRDLVELAIKNAASALRERDDVTASNEAILEELRQRLNLSRLPRVIECYDISTIQGRHSVGSGVTFKNSKPDKSNYRHYKIKDVEGQDDFAMLTEVFSRRFRPEKLEKSGLPDLVVVDGGIGQLNATLQIISKLGLDGRFDLVSLAKSRTESNLEASNVKKSDERVFLPVRKNPVVLRQNSKPLLLLTSIRDEAHRFAVEYHRKLRGKENLKSSIDGIPGIGAKRRTALLKHFGSFHNLKKASLDEILQVEGINSLIAKKVYEYLKKALNS